MGDQEPDPELPSICFYLDRLRPSYALFLERRLVPVSWNSGDQVIVLRERWS